MKRSDFKKNRNLIILSVSILLAVTFSFLVYASVLCPSGAICYKIVKSGGSQEINLFGADKLVTNNCTNDLFIPTNTSGEWSGFYNNPPSCASASSAYTFYIDADGDGYAPNSVVYTSSSSTWAGHVRTNSALGTNDCYDGNANAHPGQTSYFTTNRGDGSYDYNCDGSQSKEYTSTSAFCAICAYEPPCTLTAVGHTGWTASTAPSCGSSGTYISSTGAPNCPSTNSPGLCNGPSPACSSGSRTQACR